MQTVHHTASLAAAQEAATAVVSARTAAVTGTLHAIAALLAIRKLLLLALVGGFAVTVMALRLGTYQALGGLVAYAVLILIPIVYLERTQRAPSPRPTEPA
jgi:hypothetical protein